MMRPESFTYHAIKAKQLLDVVGNFYAQEKYEQAETTLYQILDLIRICLNQTVTAEKLEDKFPNLIFKYDLVRNYHSVTNRAYEFTRDQAIYTRNVLLTFGFSLFEVKYEGNGIIDWDTKDEPDYLVSLNLEFSTNWRIKRSENDPYRFFFTSREVPMNLEGATAMGTMVKRRYPTLTVVVYYNDEAGNRKSITVDTWSTNPGENDGSNKL